MTEKCDVLVVGSGINGLVCAALAARRYRVCVLERAPLPGGCIRTAELTRPGFLHDTLSGFHPLFVTSPAYTMLRAELEGAGLRYVHGAYPTGVVLPGGEYARLATSRLENVCAFEGLHAGDGARFDAEMRALESAAPLAFGILTQELWSGRTARLLMREAWRHGPRSLLQFFGEALRSSHDWLCRHFQSEVLRCLFAPWVLHTGLAPDSAFSGFMTRLIAYTLEAVGMPVVAGGSGQLVSAFRRIIESRGGRIVTGAEVAQILLSGGRAAGVRLANGEEYRAKRAVVCSVTPTQLYLRLLGADLVPDRIREEARAFRYGRSNMQIHLALSAPPRWRAAAMNEVMMVHLTAGDAQIRQAVHEAESGFLPAHPTIVVAQPTIADPSRAPAGGAILWIQLQELPAAVRGDAAGSIAVPADGVWSEALKEAYADRVIARLREQIENLDSVLLARKVLSPRDLEELNINLVGGDPYAGSCALDQSLFWRPIASSVRHETHIPGLYHIGASTHPGPGLSGTSGYLVAEAL
ncbi:MAG TPA: NAD(P)/FAD-dependent oxidoreductase [Steroidobacteraceae bacterium]|nr:NAD(P)/FAD-dependent oxidoreductase [Steroidobacteraceae bacterium]